jgi:hypothetical protein
VPLVLQTPSPPLPPPPPRPVSGHESPWQPLAERRAEPQAAEFDFFPETFQLPSEYLIFVEVFRCAARTPASVALARFAALNTCGRATQEKPQHDVDHEAGAIWAAYSGPNVALDRSEPRFPARVPQIGKSQGKGIFLIDKLSQARRACPASPLCAAQRHANQRVQITDWRTSLRTNPKEEPRKPARCRQRSLRNAPLSSAPLTRRRAQSSSAVPHGTRVRTTRGPRAAPSVCADEAAGGRAVPVDREREREREQAGGGDPAKGEEKTDEVACGVRAAWPCDVTCSPSGAG